jgi:hypothetical protein
MSGGGGGQSWRPVTFLPAAWPLLTSPKCLLLAEFVCKEWLGDWMEKESGMRLVSVASV